MIDINFIPHPLTGTPIGSALDVAIIIAVLVWVLNVATRDVSWIDRIWPICPIVFCFVVAYELNFESLRVNIMTFLIALWGLRLTFNFVRKGGYKVGGEDYRWEQVREIAGPIGFQLLNITFIAPGQMLIIWWFTSPVHQAWVGNENPLNYLDAIVIVLWLFFFVIQAITDEQMWSFQQDKKRKITKGEEIEQPFLKDGMFKFCRHPSYTCELGMWFVFYFFGVAATGEWLNWTGLGFIFLAAIFFGSVRLTEKISLSKYPSYSEYQAATPRLIPFTRLGCLKATR